MDGVTGHHAGLESHSRHMGEGHVHRCVVGQLTSSGTLMVPRQANFAVAVTQRVEVTTSMGISGRVIALGWPVDQGDEPASTMYLVVDPTRAAPLWVAQSDLTSTRLIE
jgi:hypothetical protein